MYGPVLPGQSRWLRLRPSDPIDLLLCATMALGLLIYVATWFVEPRLPGAALQLIGDILFRVHSSTPFLFFAGALVYLLRWGRTLANHKLWLVVGFLLTVPLLLLAGLPVGIKGFGDITLLLVPWNLLAFGVMMIGVHRSLGGFPGKSDPRRS